MPIAVPVPRFRGRYAAKASSVAGTGDVRLAVSEAATNALVHSSAGRQDARVGVAVELADGDAFDYISDLTVAY